jgi:hypothetical protein
LAALREHFVVLVETTTLGDPSKRPLNDPAPGQDHKTFLVITTQDWLQEKLGFPDFFGEKELENYLISSS